MSNASGPSFELGQTVFLASAGLARLVDFATRGEQGKPAPWDASQGPPDFYVVSNETVTACVPVARAHETLRPLVSRETAQAMLESLRTQTLPVPNAAPMLVRGREVVHSGSPLDHARFLRELYGLPSPLSEPLREGLEFFERLVLPEMAQVLGLSHAELERELKHRYPSKDR